MKIIIKVLVKRMPRFLEADLMVTKKDNILTDLLNDHQDLFSQN